jgi:EmrB/QacA subfamily drug resistance transporter
VGRSWKIDVIKEPEEAVPHPSLLQYPVIIASLSALLSSLDSAVNIAFPAITEAFSLGVTSIQWVVVGYVLTHASMLLGCGRLADVWGHGRLLTCGLFASAVAFVACGIAPTFTWLVIARIAQGMAAAAVSGSAPALLTLAVPSETRGRALGVFQMSAAAGYAIGPLIGGVLVDGFGWRAVYLFRVAPAVLLGGIAALKLAGVRQSQKKQEFDLAGAATLAAGLASFLLAISWSRNLGWTSPQVMSLMLLSAVSCAGFIITEMRVSAPVIRLSLFQRPTFVLANVLTVLANCARFAVGLLVPYYLLTILRYPATTGGTLMLAAAMMTALAAPVSGKLSDRFGTTRLSSLGLAVEALGLWMISRLDAEADYLSVAVALGVVGLGLGMFEAPNMSFVMGAVPRNQQGVAGSISNMTRTLGIVLGATGASLLFDERRQIHSNQPGVEVGPAFQPFIPAFQDVFLFAAGLCVIAFGLSLFRRPEAAASKVAGEEN